MKSSVKGSRIYRENHQNENTCFICDDLSLRTPGALECTSCSRKICKRHLRKGLDSSWFCYQCVRDEIKHEESSKFKTHIIELTDEIKSLALNKEQVRQKISAYKSTITRFESQNKVNEQKYKQKIEALEAKIEKEESRSFAVNNALEGLKTALNGSKNSEKVMSQRLALFLSEISLVQTSCENLNAEITQLDTNVIDVGAKSGELIPYKKIRTIACSKCIKEIKLKFRDQIITVLANEGRESLLQSVMNARASIKQSYPRNLEKPSHCIKCVLM